MEGTTFDTVLREMQSIPLAAKIAIHQIGMNKSLIGNRIKPAAGNA